MRVDDLGRESFDVDAFVKYFRRSRAFFCGSDFFANEVFLVVDDFVTDALALAGDDFMTTLLADSDSASAFFTVCTVLRGDLRSAITGLVAGVVLLLLAFFAGDSFRFFAMANGSFDQEITHSS